MKKIIFIGIISIGIFFGAQTIMPFPYGLIIGFGALFVFFWFWFKRPTTNSGKKIKPKWAVICVLSLIVIILLGSGAAPLIFSEIVYGCNLQRTMASGEIEQVSHHPITNAYHEKYELRSPRTSSSHSLEWGYGTVEYSSYFRDSGEEWSNAYLKITIDQCGVPQEFQFQCVDSEGMPWVSLNSKKDNVLEYLENRNCFDVKR